jgi:hypothetical protein
MREIEERFHARMLEQVYRETGRQCGYWAHRFRQLVTARGGVAAAKRLLGRAEVSPGFIALREKGRLDLSMEALVIAPEFCGLFTDAEQAEARRRLEEERPMPVALDAERPMPDAALDVGPSVPAAFGAEPPMRALAPRSGGAVPDSTA